MAAADRLEAFRRAQAGFVSLSFDTISRCAQSPPRQTRTFHRGSPDGLTEAGLDAPRAPLQPCGPRGGPSARVLTARHGSYGPNGAIIHYKPEPGACAQIGRDNLYLVDSGGQYRDGTTDVTRTLHFATPTQHQRECYTRCVHCPTHLLAAAREAALHPLQARTALLRDAASPLPGAGCT